MNSLKSWFEKMFSQDRRKALRNPSPNLAAYFWTGGSPVEHDIRDISSTGLFLVTKDRWYPGTLVIMTLQKKSMNHDDSERTVSVQSKAVRWGSDGVGLQFVLPELDDPRRGQSLLAEGVDRRSLDRFLVGLNSGNGSATIDRVVPPSD